MISSMTGFASGQSECVQGTLFLELRSINHRFLDIMVRVPEECRSLEGMIRERIAAKCMRGKVECRIYFGSQEKKNPTNLELNQPLLLNLLHLSAQLEAILPKAEKLSIGALLSWPGMLVPQSVSGEEIERTTLVLLDELLNDLVKSRTREGEKLSTLILERLEQMEAHVTGLRPVLSRVLEDYHAHLHARLVQALGHADEERLRQELVFFAQKMDVTEEMDRLSAHFLELRRILSLGGPVGKSLDFLMQELNREANTLASKSVSIETSKAAMELKILIEQIREQVQNLE